jgi:hypothetical protein
MLQKLIESITLPAILWSIFWIVIGSILVFLWDKKHKGRKRGKLRHIDQADLSHSHKYNYPPLDEFEEKIS